MRGRSGQRGQASISTFSFPVGHATKALIGLVRHVSQMLNGVRTDADARIC